jgi:hypothetical protein
MQAEYNLKLTWDEINWLRNVVREKRDFYKNASHINYKVETERSKSVSAKIENTMYPCFGD